MERSRLASSCTSRAAFTAFAARVLPVALAAAAVTPLSAAAAGADGAHGAHVRLRGAARLEAEGVRADSGDLVLRGTLIDDAGAPISEGALTVAIARAVDPSSPVALATLAGGPNAARGCAADARAPRIFTDGLHLTADGAGRFCVRLSLPVDRYVAHVGYAGAGYIDGGALDVPVDLSRRTCALSFTTAGQTLRVVSLDAASTSIDAVATLESDGAAAPGVGYALTLTTEKAATPLATATTDASGHARFTFAPSSLGPPGRGELRASFAGNAEASAAARVLPIERRAQVELDVPDAQGGKLASGSPEDGVAFLVSAHAAGGVVTTGSVEARVGDAIVGAAPVEAGNAKLQVTFGLPESAGASGEVPIALRYVPSVPWLEAGTESTWSLPVRTRSPVRESWVVLAGLAIASWFVVARAQRAKAMAKGPQPRARPAARGEAKLDVVKVAEHPGAGWRGRVIDADDGTPVATARVQIERPSFGRADVLASVVTDDDGKFELAEIERRPGDELSFEAILHVALRRPLPLASELDAQLVLRKRAMLARLVGWAKQRGRPFDVRPEPTPGHVKHAAGNDFQIARWADAVERAAYAGEPVDARVEADIERLAPVPAPAGPPEPRPALDRRALLNPTKPNR